MKKMRGNPGERGAALILTIVVIMVLTTLALTMATFTSAEERSANTYRNSMQTRAVAVAGVRMVQAMFRNPDDRALVPQFGSGGMTEAQLNAAGIWRKDRAGAIPARYSGAGNRLFRPPFNGDWASAFGGTYSPTATADAYDLKFNCRNPATNVLIANAATACWLSRLNGYLVTEDANVNLDTGRIIDISFYAPPIANGRAYGIATIRVTAEKRTRGLEGDLVARETVEAVIVDLTRKPAVLGDGDIVFKVQAGTLCGDGCEQVHANGNADVGPVSGGREPMVTATGTVTGGVTSKEEGARKVTAPEINPWDLTYKPANAAELGKYYLVTMGPLDAVWTDGNVANNPAPRPCGLNGYSLCQDYNLEYTPAGAEQPKRLASDTPYMYKWNALLGEWRPCGSGVTLSCGHGGPTFTVTRADDEEDPGGGAGDTADLPFNRRRVPRTVFRLQNASNGATVLVDGAFYKEGAMTAAMTIIAAGSIEVESATTWSPAMANRTMWVSGRDVKTHAKCCAPSNSCATNLDTPAAAGIIAAHEQIETGAQNALLGVIVAENRVSLDATVPGPLAIRSGDGVHGSLCHQPDWPWIMPVRPGLVSMRTAAS